MALSFLIFAQLMKISSLQELTEFLYEDERESLHHNPSYETGVRWEQGIS